MARVVAPEGEPSAAHRAAVAASQVQRQFSHDAILTLRAKLPDNLMLLELQVPDDAGVLRIEADEIPADADVPGADRRTWYQRTGDAWLERAETLVLMAPSIVVPKEWNAMLDPAHPRMADVTIVASEPFRLDPRLATR